MILPKPILILLAITLLILFILLPLVKRFEKWGVRKILAAFLSIFIIILLLSGGIFLFSTQIINLSTKVSDFQDKKLQVFTKATLFFNHYLSFLPTMEEGELIIRLKSWIGQSSGVMVSKTFNS